MQVQFLYQLAIDKFKEAISSSPNSKFAFFEYGKMLRKMSQRISDGDLCITLLTAAIEKLEQASDIDKYFIDAKIELAITILDLVVHKRRLWLLYRKR